jgi:nitroreductase
MNAAEIDASALREPTVPGVERAFLRRWSPRSMTGESLTDDEITTLFEAARWAPSCANAQPWRFVYARRESEHWQRMYELLSAGNRNWCGRAAMLVLVTARSAFERNDGYSPTHQFDAGAAWMSLALQASAMRLVAHGMRGFDADQARAAFAIPDLYTILAMIAVGRPGDIEALPEDLRRKERPSGRKPLAEMVREGAFVWS